MKTKELIRRLMEADPSGEEECCVGNVDIHFVAKDPAYWDGSLQVLTRNENEKQYYNIIGGKYVRSGYKIQIHTLPISQILDDPEVVIDYSQIGNEALAKRYKDSDEKTRTKYTEIHLDCEWHTFKEWCKQKGAEISGDEMDMANARAFFDKNINPDAPMPKERTQDEIDGKCVHDSYVNKRKLQWNNTINLEFDGMDWHFSFKNDE